MNTLKGKTLFITGGSRGIGLAIALRAARDGANVAIAAKSAVPNPKLPGTIHSAAAAVDTAGGHGLAVKCDIREEDDVRAAVDATIAHFGGIDILVNNASAIWLRGALDTPMKRFDLMNQVNARGSFLCAQACLPHLLKSANPHILTLAPPPSLDPKWWGPHTGYTLAKMGMCTPRVMYSHCSSLFLRSRDIPNVYVGESVCLSLIAIRKRWRTLGSRSARMSPFSSPPMAVIPWRRIVTSALAPLVSGKSILAARLNWRSLRRSGSLRRRAAIRWRGACGSSFAGA